MLIRKIILVTLLTLFSLTVVGYGIYKALPIILGPKIVLDSPKDGEIVEDTSVSVRGSVTRTNSLYINEIPTAFSESGYFETRLPIYQGSNILIVKSVDRFGRTTSKTITVGTK